MIYVTGDFHGDMEKFHSKEMKKLKKGDYLIICGDFGFIWDGSKTEQKLLKKIGKLKYNVLFMEGTHDNLDLIKSYPEVDFMGAKARNISGNLMYLQRGSIYSIENKNIFVFGGGESDDIDERQEGINWWREELPTVEETELAKARLLEYRNVVDYIVTHECSGKMRDFIHIQSNFDETNNLHRFLDDVANDCMYKVWYFGKHHLDKIVSQKAVAVFDKVLLLK